MSENPPPSNPVQASEPKLKIPTTWKWFLLIVGAGVTASVIATIASLYLTRWLENQAILAAKAEVQNLLLALGQQQQTKTLPPPEPTQPLYLTNIV